MVSLDGKIAIVTGGAQGLGEHSARRLAQCGATIVVTDRQEELGRSVADDIERGGGKACFLPLDVAQEASWRSVVANVAERFGKADILVNNAGLMEFAPLGEMEIALFDRVLGVNLRGTFLGCKLVLPLMKTAGGGSIVNVSSTAGMVPNDEGYGAYSASKGGVRLFTKAAAVDFAPFNIRVNSVHPGVMWTPRARPTLSDPAQHDAAIEGVLMKRAGDPAEVANVIAFLASDEASYMTGAEVVVDGGFLAW